MGSNLKDVYYCQQERTQELSDRMYSRNMPSHQLGASYFARPVDTYATVLPMVDCRKPATVTKAHFPVYNEKMVFNPGQSAPYNGYSRNIDVESRLHNSFAPLQKCAQGKYIPGTKMIYKGVKKETDSNASNNTAETVIEKSGSTDHNIKLTIKTEKDEAIEKFKPVSDTSTIENEKELSTEPKIEVAPGKLTFNDMDSVLDMGTNKSSEINAPKTLERLEKISNEQNQKRKEEEAEYDDDDEEESIKILDDAKLNLDSLDVHDLNTKLDLTPDPILDDIEVLA